VSLESLSIEEISKKGKKESNPVSEGKMFRGWVEQRERGNRTSNGRKRGVENERGRKGRSKNRSCCYSKGGGGGNPLFASRKKVSGASGARDEPQGSGA